MLGSLTDAEDMLQETLLAAWQGLSGLREQAALRSWLYQIATRRCLNAMRSASRRVPAEPVPPFQPPEPTRRADVTWLQPCPDTLLEGIADTAPGPEARYTATEAVELAFVAALQAMPPRRAARQERRRTGLQQALAATTDCDLIFADPGNGIRPAGHRGPAHRVKAVKHAYL